MSVELAELNIATIRGPLDSPAMADFMDALDRVNRIAETSPGFVWRLQSEAGNATAYRPFGDNVLVNLSVWRDLESLRRYVYSTDHGDFVRRRHEWFERPTDAALVCWWVPAGHRPTIEEAAERLRRLRAEGSTPLAFTFGRPFAAPPDSL